MSRARVAYEQAYVADAAELRAAVEAGEVPTGVSVRAYRAHRDATESLAVRLFGGSLAALSVLAVLGLAALALAGAATGAWPGVVILAGVWLTVCGLAARRGVARRTEARGSLLRP